MKVRIPAWDQGRVLVVGDVMLDRYWHGAASRISPEAPVPVVHIRDLEERVGGAGNVALNLAALGVQTRLLGLIGNDDSAAALTRLLAQSRVENRLLVNRDAPTITKLRVMSRHQQLIRLDFEETAAAAALGSIRRDDFAAALDGVQVVALSDYGKGALADSAALIEVARAAGKVVLVDPKNRDFGRYRGASVVTPNLLEFEQVAGPCHNDGEMVEKARQLLAQFEIEAILITRGEHGMTLVPAGGEPVHWPTEAREVFDVTGAGDTVLAFLAATLAAGESLETAAALANLAAGIAVGKMGTAVVTASEMLRALAAEPGGAHTILSEEELLAAVQRARLRNESVVMTNGCFDLLHAGHVDYLARAAELADRLIVAVNSDASVAALKGPQRPIVPLAQRMTVLAALAAVDWVVAFDEPTPERLICAVRPDVLVKGGDYTPGEVAGGECVVANGGRVEILPFVAGCSTSAIIDAIRRGGG